MAVDAIPARICRITCVQTVPVHLSSGSYSIQIDQRLLDRAGSIVSQLTSSRRIGIVTDNIVGPLYAKRLSDSLSQAGFEVTLATLPSGEQYKTLSSLLPIYDTFLHARFERTSPLIALGGGVVGDMTGFVAATLLRGVPFIQIPTTLLSMVDASVGGKTGVDHAVGKNLIGAFHQPIGVLVDPTVLTTLPPTELRSGLAECIKHECIRDANGFAKLEQNIQSILKLEMSSLTDLIAHNVAIKARVVEADPFEKGDRAHLNFGHTFGHAIETVASYTIPHGYCVALGMCAAAYTSVKLGLLPESVRQRIVTLIERAELPTGRLALNIDDVIHAMAYDKKVKSGEIRFVLLDQLGHAIVRHDVPPSLVRDALESLRG